MPEGLPRVAAGDLRPLQQHDPLLGRGPDAREEFRRDRVADRRESLLGAQLFGDLAPRRAPSAAREELEAMSAERREPGRSVDQLVDAGPQRR